MLESVRDTLETFNLSFERSDATIIPGAEEGLAAWITSNYIMNSLARPDEVSSVYMYMFSVVLLISWKC